MKSKTLAIVGCGKLAKIVLEALIKGLLPDYQLIATYSRTFEKAENIASKINESQDIYTCSPCRSLDEVFALKPDYIVETASPSSLKELAVPALQNGLSIVTLSIGAFADENFYSLVQKTALTYGTRVHLASGAIGGFDVLRTVSLMEKSEVTFTTMKGPNSLKNTEVYTEKLQTETCEVFSGNAAEAIALFPTRVNVAVAAALASTGPEKVKVSINSLPGFVGDDHRIEIKSDQIHAVVDVYSKTAQIAGWSVVNTLRNITSPIVF
ncbi:aspartate dehydrogenase domain-containing protein [Kaistella palustris]|uniref:aspartate dehydrogenase domain-containing protein n=1 Tax=Kaistella palustris TaxID=493376 RepID=UPI000486E9E5|nr:aspartate dehydrogenase domain-containing protein [Kaistella palustris]